VDDDGRHGQRSPPEVGASDPAAMAAVRRSGTVPGSLARARAGAGISGSPLRLGVRRALQFCGIAC
jgi:hypothetical protein